MRACKEGDRAPGLTERGEVDMHYTLILYHNEKEHLSLVRWLIDSLREKTQLSHQEEEGVIEGADRVFVRFCPVNENFEVVDGGIEKKWTTLNSLKIENVSHTHSLDACSAENEPDSSESVPVLPNQNAFLPNHLHDIADSLPFTGFTLDVYVISLDMKIESCMLTVGALLRFREWHKAQVHLVGEAEKWDDKVTLTLCEVLDATFLCADHLACVPWPVWRGDLVWPGEKGFVQQGMRLECADRERFQDKLLELEFWSRRSCEEDYEMEDIHADAMLGHHLEVLTHIRLNSVPLYLIDDFSLQLTPASSFGQLVGTLNHKDALLLRIPLHGKGTIPLASAHGLTTTAWKEGIAASAQNASDPGKGPLGCRQYLFLMISGNQDVSCPLTVNVLRSPSEVDLQLFDEVHEACFYGCAPLAQSQMVSDNKICDLDNLPLLTAADFHSTDDACSQSLVQCVKEKKSKTNGEGPVEVTEGELLACVREGQELFLQQGQKQSPSRFGERKPVTDFDFVPLQDLERLCSEWPERRALLENESKAKVLRRYQSNESCSLMLSSPLGPEDSSMDAKDMVKWFRPDGNAVHEDLSPVKPAVRPLQLSNYEEVNLEWPACKDLQYHDVYYEHTKKSEKQEKFFQKFRDNILLEESLHVCSDKPGVPALRYRNHSRRSQMDISCGGSKLTPITRQTLSPNSMLQATPSAKRRLSRESEGQESTKSKSSSRGDGNFSVPKARMGKNRSRSVEGHRSGRQSSEKLSYFEETSKENSSQSSSSVFYPKGSDPTLPPFRRLSQPDVSIFTPVSSRKSSGHAPSGSDSSQGASALSRKQSSASSSSGKDEEGRQPSESVDSTTPHKSNQDRKARSQKHKRRLEKVVTKVLGEAGVSTNNTLYTACFSKLYQVSYFYAKQLPDSHNLKGELKSIAEKQVEQVVDLERRRKDLAVKKKLRKSSLVGQKPSE